MHIRQKICIYFWSLFVPSPTFQIYFFCYHGKILINLVDTQTRRYCNNILFTSLTNQCNSSNGKQPISFNLANSYNWKRKTYMSETETCKYINVPKTQLHCRNFVSNTRTYSIFYQQDKNVCCCFITFLVTETYKSVLKFVFITFYFLHVTSVFVIKVYHISLIQSFTYNHIV